MRIVVDDIDAVKVRSQVAAKGDKLVSLSDLNVCLLQPWQVMELLDHEDVFTLQFQEPDAAC